MALMKMHFDSEESASVTLLGPGHHHGSLTAQVLSSSGRRLTLTCAPGAFITVPTPGTPVKIEWSGYLILGEVVTFQEAVHTIALRIRHVFRNEDVEHIQQQWT